MSDREEFSYMDDFKYELSCVCRRYLYFYSLFPRMLLKILIGVLVLPVSPILILSLAAASAVGRRRRRQARDELVRQRDAVTTGDRRVDG